MKSPKYMDRAMRHSDPRFRNALAKLGYQATPAAKPAKAQTAKPVDPLDHDRDGRKGGAPKPDAAGGDLSALRSEYETALGKKPFMGWDADTLRQKISDGKREYQRRDMTAGE